MALDRAFSRKVNDHLHGVLALPMPTEHRVRLMTVNGTATTSGTEVASGGGYVSGSGAPLVDYGSATDVSPTLSGNEVAIMVSSWPRAETVVGVEIWGLVGGTPTRMEFGALTAPVTMVIGGNFALDVAALATALG